MIGYDGSDPKPGLTIQMVPVSSFLCPCRVRAKDGVQRLRVRNLAGVSRSTAGLIVPRVVCGRGQDPAPGISDLFSGPPARPGVDFSASSQNAWAVIHGKREKTRNAAAFRIRERVCRGRRRAHSRDWRAQRRCLGFLQPPTKPPSIKVAKSIRAAEALFPSVHSMIRRLERKQSIIWQGQTGAA